MFRIALGTQTFSNISARIWNALIIKIDINVPLFKFKDSLKLFSLNNNDNDNDNDNEISLFRHK